MSQYNEQTTYPDSALQGLSNGELDIAMEQWPVEYDNNVLSRIENLGSNGLAGTTAWYVPSYLANDHPEVVEDPSALGALEGRFIEDNGAFEILAGSPNYMATKQSKVLISNYSLNAEIRSSNSEPEFSMVLQQLYAERKYFVAVHYSPHTDHHYLDLVPLKVNCSLITMTDCWFPHQTKISKQVSQRLNTTMPDVFRYIQNYFIAEELIYATILQIRITFNNYEFAVCNALKANPDLIDQFLHGSHTTTYNPTYTPTMSPSLPPSEACECRWPYVESVDPTMAEQIWIDKGYGSHCYPWESSPLSLQYSACIGASEEDLCGDLNYCQWSWCYVSEGCESAFPSNAMRGAYYSYEVCGVPNCFDFPNQEDCPWNCTSTDEDSDACTSILDPCLCVGDGCGWNSEMNKCINGSVTICHECNSLSDCLRGSCEEFGCPKTFNASLTCQCTDECVSFNNCCPDITNSLTCHSRALQQCESTTRSTCTEDCGMVEMVAMNGSFCSGMYECQPGDGACPHTCDPQWADADGVACHYYLVHQWCTPLGGYGAGWESSWGTFEDKASSNGRTAEVCPQCGCEGGGQEGICQERVTCAMLNYDYGYDRDETCGYVNETGIIGSYDFRPGWYTGDVFIDTNMTCPSICQQYCVEDPNCDYFVFRTVEEGSQCFLKPAWPAEYSHCIEYLYVEDSLYISGPEECIEAPTASDTIVELEDDDLDADCMALTVVCGLIPLMAFFLSRGLSIFVSHDTSSFHTLDELYGGRRCSVKTLCPKLDVSQSVIFPKRQTALEYLKDQSITTIGALLMQLADVVSDTLFAYDNYHRGSRCIGMISTASVFFSTAALLICWFLDYASWQNAMSRKNRRRYRLRWSILILTPLEDLVLLVLSAYLFWTGNDTFYCYLCVVASACMIVIRFFNICFIHHGVFDSSRKSVVETRRVKPRLKRRPNRNSRETELAKNTRLNGMTVSTIGDSQVDSFLSDKFDETPNGSFLSDNFDETPNGVVTPSPAVYEGEICLGSYTETSDIVTMAGETHLI